MRHCNCKSVLALILLLCTVAVAQETHPAASPEATIISGNARFTILTPRIIRLEWSESGIFEDRASLVFIHRQTPVPEFSSELQDGTLVISTAYLELTYVAGSGKFGPDNLSVRLNVAGESVTWKPGMAQTGNLGGTARTLDGFNGGVDGDGNPIDLGIGVASRDGWVLFDDSQTLLFDGSEWNWVVERLEGEKQDWYFFGHGHDYKGALADFTTIAGRIPMPPKYAFGYWWSRYWAYSDYELRQLMQKFKSMQIPLDVLIIDMDWHKTFGFSTDVWERDEFNLTLGWTGYTWNSNLFPDPERFLQWTDEQNLKTALNLHPASGIPYQDDIWQAFGEAIGFDTSQQRNIPYAMADKQWAKTYFNVLLQPFCEQGIDFWWIDWQQYKTSTIVDGLNNTWWLNYTFYTHMQRSQEERPLLFHRWGGLGNHRYQIGFSGDAYISWKELAFQPYFTATAANVGYGYWSHDIGGHHQPGKTTRTEGELYLRWLQFGVFSPIVRTHSTKSVLIERRFWEYPEHFDNLRDAIHLRYALAPYIYNASRAAYDSGISIIRPLYYEYPEREEAYEQTQQYLFGPDVLVAPVVSPIHAGTGTAERSFWLPPGEWYEWFTGTLLKGDQRYERSYSLSEIPVFVKAGSILPMYPLVKNLQQPVDTLILTVFPGGRGQLYYYEDDGATQAYQQGEFTRTPIESSVADGVFTVVIHPREGEYEGMLKRRRYRLDLLHRLPPEQVLVNGREYSYAEDSREGSWCYDGRLLAVVITMPAVACDETQVIRVTWQDDQTASAELLQGLKGRFRRISEMAELLKNEGTKASWRSALPPLIRQFEQTPTRITYFPGDAEAEICQFNEEYAEFLNAILAFNDVSEELRQRAVEYLKQ